MAELGALTGLPILNLEEDKNQGVDPIVYNVYQTKSQTPGISDQEIQRLYGTTAMPVFEWAKKIQTGQRTYNPYDAFDESMMEMYESFDNLPDGMMTAQELMAQQALQGTFDQPTSLDLMFSAPTNPDWDVLQDDDDDADVVSIVFFSIDTSSR